MFEGREQAGSGGTAPPLPRAPRTAEGRAPPRTTRRRGQRAEQTRPSPARARAPARPHAHSPSPRSAPPTHLPPATHHAPANPAQHPATSTTPPLTTPLTTLPSAQEILAQLADNEDKEDDDKGQVASLDASAECIDEDMFGLHLAGGLLLHDLIYVRSFVAQMNTFLSQVREEKRR